MNKINTKRVTYFFLGFLAGLLCLVAAARLIWHGKFYPGVYIGTVNIGELTRDEGQSKLQSVVDNYAITLSFNGTTWQLPKEVLQGNINESIQQAYRLGRRWRVEDYVGIALSKNESFSYLANADQSKLNEWVDQITQAVEISPVYARVEVTNKQVEVVNGIDGIIVDRETLKEDIDEHVKKLDSTPIEIPMRAVKRSLDKEQLEELKRRAEAIIGDTLEIRQDDEKIVLKHDELAKLLIDEGAVREYVTSLSTLLNKPPQDAKFNFENSRVKEFAPSKDGIEVDVEATTKLLSSKLENLIQNNDKEILEVAVIRTSPDITTDKVNDLGISERIGRGESYYAHSIPNRVFNVGLASSRVNGALVAPGEEFSFNKFVGEISGATGYRTAYVISNGRTVLGDGGGVCQVSTTLFRAAMNAGLPISERWAHAYRVGYYEQNSAPGIDATVYSPSKDFKFVNDTKNHILVQAINDPKNLHLVFEIYGTKDGRVSSITKPVVTGISPPPPDLYEDDPNLPAGQIKQVDWSAWGAKASFDYVVTKDGETIFQKTYTSNYRPWQNVYLRGTGGAPTQ